MDPGNGLVAVDFHPLDFIERKDTAKKDRALVATPLAKQVFIPQLDQAVGPGYSDLRGRTWFSGSPGGQLNTTLDGEFRGSIPLHLHRPLRCVRLELAALDHDFQ